MAEAEQTSPLFDQTDASASDAPITARADLGTFKRWFRADAQHSAGWRTDATEDYDFVAGEQWTDEDKEHLRKQLRPAIVFNRIEPLMRSVSGTEVTNRQEVRYLPREEGDAQADEVLTSAAQWFRDESDAEDEESDAFLDAAICGMGWTESRLDLEADPAEPMPLIERVDPLEIYWDCNSRRRNLVDASRVWRVRKIARADAEAMFPDADPTILDATWVENVTSSKPVDREQSLQYSGEQNKDNDDEYGLVTLVQVQWIERRAAYKVADPASGQTIEVSEAEHKTLTSRAAKIGIPIQSVRISKKVCYQAFLGKDVLKTGPAPCPDHFTLQCITAFRDRNKGIFYGLVRQMKDPQRWANKWLSQTLHIMNSDSKGGWIAEQGIADDPRKFEDSLAKTEMITYVAPGSLSNPNGARMQRKEAVGFPAGFFNLMQFAISSVRDVTGINLEMLGMREADQAASLEYQRRQAGMTILATLFDSLRRYRKNQGRVMLYYIQHHLNDGRLIRIVGQDQAKYAPLAVRADARYDIIIDDSPSSPNQKEMTWATLQPMLAIIGKMIESGTIPPDIMLDLAQYSPIPASVIDKIRQRAKASAEDPGKQAQAQLQQKMAELQAAVMEMDARLKGAMAEKAQADAMKTQSEIGQGPNGNIDAARLAVETQMKQAGMETDVQLQREKMAGDWQMENQRMLNDATLQRQKALLDSQTKIRTAAISARVREGSRNGN